eukprot:CAMPEP_0201917756 /NCGR_PEP_ID=MMETSP0903-20130614/7055_1 /ASSEMBLY_ACC=CAM_ASM_000552 /TAXON_ID=420261 /ORGANISM="Thalassiosira antarctica, Strain CCMP982" /LENGTH=59 /DNA_ID=CAMNT_0048453871 /DNA_START=127 /DNA_END=306 /DNA_ORIENTATION=-
MRQAEAEAVLVFVPRFKSMPSSSSSLAPTPAALELPNGNFLISSITSIAMLPFPLPEGQ